jgi:predicted aspartyl protease
MGLTTQVVTVRPARRSRREATVKFLVDSGAVYSLVPSQILRRLGLRPYREVTFSLVDGTTVTRKVGDAYFEINGDLGPAPVIFGEEGDEPLLGGCGSHREHPAGISDPPQGAGSRRSSRRSGRTPWKTGPSTRLSSTRAAP